MALRLGLNRVNSTFHLFTLRNSFGRTMADRPVKEIKFEDLKKKLESGKINLIDVREPKELKEDGKIPDSVNIPLGEITDAFKLPDLTFKSKYGFPKPRESEAFVLSCKSGKRATVAFNNLSPFGYENALVYIGSFQDWVSNNGTVVKE